MSTSQIPSQNPIEAIPTNRLEENEKLDIESIVQNIANSRSVVEADETITDTERTELIAILHLLGEAVELVRDKTPTEVNRESALETIFKFETPEGRTITVNLGTAGRGIYETIVDNAGNQELGLNYDGTTKEWILTNKIEGRPESFKNWYVVEKTGE